jgi:hypothetical protein
VVDRGATVDTRVPASLFLPSCASHFGGAQISGSSFVTRPTSAIVTAPSCTAAAWVKQPMGYNGGGRIKVLSLSTAAALKLRREARGKQGVRSIVTSI